MCTATRNGTDRQLRATSLHHSTRLRCTPAVDVSAPTSTINLHHRPNSTLFHYYKQQQHRLASRLPPPHINVARAIRFSFTSQKLQHSNTCATPRPRGTTVLQLDTTPRPDSTQDLSTTLTPLFFIKTSLLQHTVNVG